MTRPRPVYLVNFACYKPEESLKCSKKRFMEQSRMSGFFTEEIPEFQRKILERSGLGDDTYLPEAVLSIPPDPSMKAARKEAEYVMFGVWGPRRAISKDLSKSQRHWDPNCELQPIQPNSIALSNGCQSLKASREYKELQPRWDGMQCGHSFC